MKSVLISIQPKWCKLIAEGKKTVEVRKTKPKIDVPFKCYIYCTKDGKNLIKGDISTTIDFVAVNGGKVIGEFVCDKIQEITYTQIYNFGRYKDVCEAETRLDFYTLDDYLKQKNGYGWHITDLIIYDKPKELEEFQPVCKYNMDSECVYWDDCKHKAITTDWGYVANMCNKKITRPPQSWCYVEDLGV